MMKRYEWSAFQHVRVPFPDETSSSPEQVTCPSSEPCPDCTLLPFSVSDERSLPLMPLRAYFGTTETEQRCDESHSFTLVRRYPSQDASRFMRTSSCSILDSTISGEQQDLLRALARRSCPWGSGNESHAMHWGGGLRCLSRSQSCDRFLQGTNSSPFLLKLGVPFSPYSWQIHPRDSRGYSAQGVHKHFNYDKGEVMTLDHVNEFLTYKEQHLGAFGMSCDFNRQIVEGRGYAHLLDNMWKTWTKYNEQDCDVRTSSTVLINHYSHTTLQVIVEHPVMFVVRFEAWNLWHQLGYIPLSSLHTFWILHKKVQRLVLHVCIKSCSRHRPTIAQCSGS